MEGTLKMFILQTPRAQKHQMLGFCQLCAAAFGHSHSKHTQAATAQTSPTSAPTKSTELFISELEPAPSPAEKQAALEKYKENLLRSRTLQTGLKYST